MEIMNVFFSATELQFSSKEKGAFELFGLIFSALIIVFILVVVIIGLRYVIARYLAPLYRKKRKDSNYVWFDVAESSLCRGSKELWIPDNTIEFYVCKLVFSKRGSYRSDSDIMDAYDLTAPMRKRSVYQAVIRLNTKIKSELGLDNLFVYRRGKTGLNKRFRN